MRLVPTKIRIPDELLEALDKLAEAKQTDRSKILRLAIERGLQGMCLDHAIEAYQRGNITAWSAAGQTGVDLLDLLAEMQRRGVWFETDEQMLLDQIQELV